MTPKIKAQTKKKPIIICEDLEKIYSNTKVKVHALRGVNIQLLEGEFIAIIGSSGSGKTTLLNLIGLLDKPTKGKIFYKGQDITTFSEKERSNYRQKIGFIFQDFNLHPILSVEQNIELPMVYAEKLTKFERLKKVQNLLIEMNLIWRRKHLPSELSSGEKQRVGIARALANEPEIILADQPTGNLDSERGKEIIELLISLRDKYNITILLVTHNLDETKRADRVLTIVDGQFSLVNN